MFETFLTPILQKITYIIKDLFRQGSEVMYHYNIKCVSAEGLLKVTYTKSSNISETL